MVSLRHEGNGRQTLLAVLGLVAGPLHDFAAALYGKKDPGDVDALVDDALSLAEKQEWRSDSVPADAVRALLREVLLEIAGELTDMRQRDALLLDAIRGGPSWTQRFVTADAAVVALSDPSLGVEAGAVLEGALVALADLTGSWVRANPATEAGGVSAVHRALLLGNERAAAALDALEAHAAETTDAEQERKRKLAERLLTRSTALFTEIGSEFRPDGSDLDDRSFYVARDVEPTILSRIRNERALSLLLIGEAGHGKTSLLWSVGVALVEPTDPVPVLLSAAWMEAVAGSAESFSVSDVLDAFSTLARPGVRLVLLLDTADLLLHTENSVFSTEELLQGLQALEVTVIATVRPLEHEALDPAREWIKLHSYSDTEMDRATRALMAKYFHEHLAEDGIALVRQARTRMLPVLEILQSPLLLRMLFELAGDTLPSMELDVTDLYRQYWTDRIVEDRRSPHHRASSDLGPIAQRTAIALLSQGTPDIPEDDLLETIDAVEFPHQGELSAQAGIRELVSRGVLIRTGRQRRFFHQTMFEYAAARGLFSRGGVAEADRLVSHLSSQPMDLFVGAVLEQLLILLTRNRAFRADAVRILERLLASDHATTLQIAVVVWAHQPDVEIEPSSALGRLTPEGLRRFLAAIPRARTAEAGRVAALIEAAFRLRAEDCFHDVILAMNRLSKRDGPTIAALYERLGLTAFFAEGRGRQSLSNPQSLWDLVIELGRSDPALLRSASLALLPATPSAEWRARLLESIAERWEEVGNPAFLDEVIECVTRGITYDTQLPRAVQSALGSVLHASANGRDWTAHAREVLTRVGPGPNSVELSVGLAAVSAHLRTLSETSSELEGIVKAVLDMDVAAGPPRIVPTVLAPIVGTAGAASDRLRREMTELLVHGLPIPFDRKDVRPSGNWAIVVLATLLDEEVPASVSAEITAGFREESAWLEPERLLPLLGASASVSSAVVPRRVVSSIAEGSTALSPVQSVEFLKGARRFVADDPLIARAFVVVAVQLEHPGRLGEAAQSPTGIAALAAHSARVAEILQRKVPQEGKDRNPWIPLWRSLQATSVLAPAFDELVAALENTAPAADQVHLLEMIASAVKIDSASAPAALEVIKTYTRHHIAESKRDADETAPPPIVDAAFAAYRTILASTGDMSAWATLLELSFTPSFSSGGTPSPTQLIDVSSFLHRLTADREYAQAANCLVSAALMVATAGFSPKQTRTACAILHAHVTRLTTVLDPGMMRDLIGRMNEFPKILAEACVRAALRRPDGRSSVVQALHGGELHGGIATYAAHKLTEVPRDSGVGSLPELLRRAQ